MVREILAAKGGQVITIGGDSTALDAARVMSARRIGALVVTDGETPVGILSERDLMDRLVARQRDPATTRVSDLMTAPLIVGSLGTTLDECKTVMSTRRIRHLPIIEDGRLVGMISTGDVIAADARAQAARIANLEQTVTSLEEYMHGPRS